MVPQDVLNSGTCEYVNSLGNRDFADRIKLRVLKWGEFP
jgi:hypothetical protein